MNPSVNYPFHSLEDYLTSKRLDVDGLLNDGWGAYFPVKGREIDAVILFVDIANFAGRTQDMSPIETLIFVNNFFAWISAESLRSCNCIVDKYIGDEVMVIFSTEFGSVDPFREALVSARWIVEHDVLSFCPHIGLAQGRVCVGYVGTPLRYSCSVFGLPVVTAARCCAVRSEDHNNSITLPADLWRGRNLDDYFKPERLEHPVEGIVERPHFWSVEGPRTLDVKNTKLEIIEIVSDLMHLPSMSADDRAKHCFQSLKKEGSFHPMCYSFEVVPKE